MWTLLICYATFQGVCGTTMKINYPSEEVCVRYQTTYLKQIGPGGWALCFPKDK